MIKYTCDPCGYTTNYKSHLDKHNTTSKHHKKIDSINKNPSVISKNLIINDDKKYQCNFCEQYFANNSGLSRHRKTCSTQNTLIESYENQISNLKEQLEYFKSLVKENKTNGVFVQNNSLNVIGPNALNYVNTHYNNAPLLLPLNDFAFIYENNETNNYEDIENDDNDDKIETFTNNVLHHQINNTLDSYLGSLIVDSYKKDDPKKQPLWNTDTNRLTYLVRELIGTKPNWIIDKKGIMTTEKTIDPLLKYVRKLIDVYLKINSAKLQEEENYGNANILFNLNTAATIIKVIDDTSLSISINKYIAPHFYLNKNVKLLEQ
jgi:hypothetical protein